MRGRGSGGSGGVLQRRGARRLECWACTRARLAPHTSAPARAPASRCAKCNGDFLPDPLPAAALPPGHGVPPGILEKHAEYWVCERCRCAGEQDSWEAHPCPPPLEGLAGRPPALAPHPRAEQGPSPPPPPPTRARRSVFWTGNQYGRAVGQLTDLLAGLELELGGAGAGEEGGGELAAGGAAPAALAVRGG